MARITFGKARHCLQVSMQYWFGIFLGSLMLLVGCGSSSSNSEVSTKPLVAVSIAPYKYFVEQLAGDLVDVVVIVPDGADPHHYEVSAKQMQRVTAAKLWVKLGEAFESRLDRMMQSCNYRPTAVDIRDIWPHEHVLVHEHEHEHEHGECCSCHLVDRHFWMSPKRAAQQAELIADGLIRAFPEHKIRFQRKLRLFTDALNQLALDIEQKLSSHHGECILVSHPALGHFCDDFGLHQLSLEIEGRQATPQQLAHLISDSQAHNISIIFTQQQHNPAGAQWMGERLGVPVRMINPYRADYVEMLQELTVQICETADRDSKD